MESLQFASQDPVLHSEDPVNYVDADLVDGSQKIDSDIVFSVRQGIVRVVFLKVEALLNRKGKRTDFNQNEEPQPKFVVMVFQNCNKNVTKHE